MSAPAIRFPGEADDWLETPFDEACRTVSTRGHQLQTNAFATSGELPVVDQGTSLVAGYTDNHELRFDNVPVIVFGDHTTSLKFIDFPFVVGADGTKLIQPVDADARFLYYSLIRNNVEQEGYKRHFSILREKILSLPSLSEQCRIAGALSAVDAKIDLLRRKRDALARFKAGLMQKLFSQEVRFTREDGSMYPDWEEKKIRDLLTICYGKDHKHLGAGKIPVYGTGGLMRYVDTALHIGPSILIGRKGTIDKPRYVEGPFWTVDTVFYTKVKEGLDPFMLFSILQTVEWLNLNEASGVPSLNANTVGSVLITIPTDIYEQRQISAALRAFDEKIESVSQQITTIQAFKKGLLQQMFV